MRFFNPFRRHPNRPPIIDLSTEQGYEIAAAIRGPDSDTAGGIKWVFTARIRHLAHVDVMGGTIRPDRISQGEAMDALAGVRAWREHDSDRVVAHFFNHTASAAAGLGEYNLARLAKRFADGHELELTVSRIIEWAGGD